MSHLSFLFLLTSVLAPPIGETGTASILWAQTGGGGIYMADLQTGYRRLVTDTAFFVNGLAADVPSQTVFWSEHNEGLVARAGWDGSNRADIYQTSPDGTPNGLALDSQARKLYWAEYSWDGQNVYGRIRKSELDGSNVDDVVQGSAFAPLRLAIDPDANKLFWSDNAVGGAVSSIKRANLDGSSIETIIDLEHTGRSLAISPDGTKLYYVVEGDGVFRSNLDGSDVEFVLNIGGGSDVEPLSLALLADGSGMYVGTFNSIWKANLDGSNLQPFITDTGFVQAMSIVPEPASAIGCCALALSLVFARRRHFLPRV